MEITHTIKVNVEKNKDGHFWGFVERQGDFVPTGQGETLEALFKNVKDSIEDYVEHEGKEAKFWSKMDLNNVEFIAVYD